MNLWRWRIFSELLCWENYGYELSGCAANGVKALELIEKKKPDIVFTDISMPIMDGIELCKNISEKYPGIKIGYSYGIQGI